MKSNSYKEAWRDKYEKRSAELSLIINPLPEPPHTQTVMWRDIESFITHQGEKYGFIFNDEPDFQRAHVWTQQQQIAFLEGVIRGTVVNDLLSITLNNPLFDYEFSRAYFDDNRWDSELPKEIQVIDGKQRLRAIRQFIKDDFPIFGNLYCSDLAESYFSVKSRTIRISTMAFVKKADLLNYYIAINTGGTVHTTEEIKKVQKLLAQCQ